jgi:magnesium transporter
MILVYTINGNAIQKKEIAPGQDIPPNIVWIDMCNPSLEEKKYIETCFNIDVLTSEEISRIEVMSPFYKSKEAYYMTLTTLNRADKEHLNGIAFTSVILNNCLITLHYDPMPIITHFVNLTKYEIEIYKIPEVLLSALTEVFIHDIGEVLENTGDELDSLIHRVLDSPVKKPIKNSTNDYNKIISKIGRTGNVISRGRESLMSINRLIIYFIQIEGDDAVKHRLRLKHMAREIESLTEYASFLAQRTSFLLDAALGMLSVEQNMIIKVFTIATAVFMPPTLIASVYGMNFGNMPEKDWEYGYPIALIVMVISAVLPYLFFKRRGWV